MNLPKLLKAKDEFDPKHKEGMKIKIGSPPFLASLSNNASLFHSFFDLPTMDDYPPIVNPSPSKPSPENLFKNPNKDYWLYKRKRTRENRKAARQAAAAASNETPSSYDDDETPNKVTKLVEGSTPVPTVPFYKRWRKEKIEDIQFSKTSIVIDLAYESVMNDKKKCAIPPKLYLTSYTEGSKMHQVFANHDGFHTWKLFVEEKSVEQVFDPKKLVFLSPDSEEVLESLNPEDIYVIGGIVDDNQLKGLSEKRSKSIPDVRSVRLPIKEFFPSFTNQSLNINHVVEVFCQLDRGADMKSSLEAAIPKRYLTTKAVWPPKKPKEHQNAEEEQNDES